MCVSPIRIPRFSCGRYHHTDTFACGHCVECQQAKQNAYLTRVYREAVKTYKLSFVTLTYRPSEIPIMRTSWYVDADGICVNEAEQWKGHAYDPDEPSAYQYKKDSSGKTVRVKVRNIKSDAYSAHFLTPFEDKIIRPQYVALANSAPAFEYDTVNDDRRFTCCCASLRRRDVRLWIKATRVAYEREFGEKIPEFKYMFVGEYGSRGYRPHYHGFFIGLDDKYVDYFVNRWRKQYGFVWKKSIPADSSQIEAVSKYVSKYMTKGCFDIPHLKDGVCELPRIIISRNVGALTDAECYFYQCKDLLPQQCPNGMSLLDNLQYNDDFAKAIHFLQHFYDNVHLDSGDYKSMYLKIFENALGSDLIHSLCNRKYFLINGKHYKISRYYSNKLYKYEIEYAGNKSGKKTFDTPLYASIKCLEGLSHLEIYGDELDALSWEFPDKSPLEIAQIKTASDEFSRKSRELYTKSKLKASYQKSKI